MFPLTVYIQVRNVVLPKTSRNESYLVCLFKLTSIPFSRGWEVNTMRCNRLLGFNEVRVRLARQ